MTRIEKEAATAEITSFQKLMQPLDEALAEIESSRRIHHLEKLSFKALITLMIYH